MLSTRYDLILRDFVNSFPSKQTRKNVFTEQQNANQQNSNVSFADQQGFSASFANQKGLSTLFANQRGSGNRNERKRKATDNNDNRNAYAPPCALGRIFGNYFPLTKTCYKYLNIGINLTIPSRVEIALGDAQGKEITLTFEIWKSILNNRDVILRFLDTPLNGIDDAPNPIRIEYLTLSFGRINNLRILQMETPIHRLALSRNTVRNMFVMEFHVNHIFQLLDKITSTVDAKLARFLAIIADIRNPVVAQAIRNHSSFNRNNYIESVLFAQIFAV